MSNACNIIKNYSEKVSNNYEKCVQFVRGERQFSSVDPMEINDCINQYCQKAAGPGFRMSSTNYKKGGTVDLSAGVF